MKYNIFISYPMINDELVQNLKDRFEKNGVNAWVYSIDRTVAENTWLEIEGKIKESDLIIFIVSEATLNSEGQNKELSLAISKIEPLVSTGKIMPIFITGTDPKQCPEILKNKNGEFLDGGNVKSVAHKISKRLFPNLFESKRQQSWNYPTPGEWLEISELDPLIEAYFEIGDKLYFRSISPMGLLECYTPKINGLFWIAPKNVIISSDTEKDKNLERNIPQQYTVMGMTDILLRGWSSWHESNK